MTGTLPTVDPDGDRRRGPGGEGPALLGQHRRPQPDRRPIADIAEAVVGGEAAVVVAAGNENRPPAVRRLLQVLDRDELAATRYRRTAAPHPAAQRQRLPGAEAPRGGPQGGSRAHAQLEPRSARRVEPLLAGEGDRDPSRGPRGQAQLEAALLTGPHRLHGGRQQGPARGTGDDAQLAVAETG